MLFESRCIVDLMVKLQRQAGKAQKLSRAAGALACDANSPCLFRQLRYIGKTAVCMQEPLLDLLVRHMDSKGKQAKLKSPQELQELLDVTRALLADMDKERQSAAQAGGPGGSPDLAELKLDADQDELREKFGIVRVSKEVPSANTCTNGLHARPLSEMLHQFAVVCSHISSRHTLHLLHKCGSSLMLRKFWNPTTAERLKCR